MSNIKNPDFPITTVEMYANENSEILTPRYISGNPRDYRLDMGLGALCIGKRNAIKGLGKELKILPIAIRVLKGKLFLKKEQREAAEEKKWAEVYFVNEAGHLCLFMFHGYSVDNLDDQAMDLLYAGTALTEVLWTISLKEKTNKQGDTYHMAYFHFDFLSEDDLAIHKQVIENTLKKYHHINRQGTIEEKTLYQENWSDGTEMTEAEIKEAEELEAKRLAEFEPKDKVAEKKGNSTAAKRAKKKLEKVA